MIEVEDRIHDSLHNEVAYPISDSSRKSLGTLIKLARSNYPSEVLVEDLEDSHEFTPQDTLEYMAKAVDKAPSEIQDKINPDIAHFIDSRGQFSITPRFETLKKIDIQKRKKELVPYTELAHASLLLQRNGEINGHGERHIRDVVRIADQLLKSTGHKDKRTRKATTLAALYHDIGNGYGRGVHSIDSGYIFSQVEKGIPQYSKDWIEIMTAIRCHESEFYNTIREPLMTLAGNERISIMRKKLGTVWAALTAADKLDEGPQRFNDLQIEKGALEGHDHSTINLLFRTRGHGPKRIFEDGKEKNKYLIETGYYPILTLENGTLQKYNALAQNPDAEESYVDVPSRFISDTHHNEPDFHKLRIRRGELYRDRIEITIEALFVLDDTLEEIDWNIYDETTNEIVSHRFRLSHLNQDLEQLRKAYPRKSDEKIKAIDKIDA